MTDIQGLTINFKLDEKNKCLWIELYGGYGPYAISSDSISFEGLAKVLVDDMKVLIATTKETKT